MENYNYLIRRKVLCFFGAKFHIYDANQNLIGFCKQKAFKLKEDIRIYTDESCARELVVILARNVIDFSACYDVIDPATGALLGSWKRKGWSSLVRDSWEVYDPYGVKVAELSEDSMGLALVRRLLTNLVPQNFELRNASGLQTIFRQCFNPFVYKLQVSLQPNCNMHPYMILAGGILLAAIEGRQN
jgi:hypothetical protein